MLSLHTWKGNIEIFFPAHDSFIVWDQISYVQKLIQAMIIYAAHITSEKPTSYTSQVAWIQLFLFHVNMHTSDGEIHLCVTQTI